MHVDPFLDAARRLVAIPSTADRPDRLAAALDFVLDYLGPGFAVERFLSNGKPSALVYAGPERPHFRVLFNGHLDVVPGAPEQFRPRLDGERLHGRGTQDMKLSALIMAQVFRERARECRYPLGLQLVTDEEVGGRDGTLHQLEQGVGAEFVIIGEYSGLRVVNESRGILNAHLTATGHSGHSAYQWRGDNAILRLIRGLDGIMARYPVAVGEVWRTTVNVARIETTNTALNQIPARAEAWLDIRYPPEDTDLNGRSAAEIAEYLAGLCSDGVTVAVPTVDPPHRADPRGADVLTLQNAARTQGYSGDLLRKHGAADSRFYYQRGIDAVIFGIGGDGLHGPAEYADLTTVRPYHAALTEFLRLTAEK